ncbi:hypothetical protein NDU88_006200 [Pleurodeles waltl]|uniref:NADP-dependent oxidoreductase domain-containing protein n=1 Tax=Pleurodeles waltl TaxID=8319 RepID=A0AAV7QGX3_PLEWA|nr:hypothetical protein NDU88_006200 [Pleurodeles waltl]
MSRLASLLAVMARSLLTTVLGNMAFGSSLDQSGSAEVLHKFLPRGFDQLDTAYMYGDSETECVLRAMGVGLQGNIHAGAFGLYTVQASYPI